MWIISLCCPGFSQSRHRVRENPDDRSLFWILPTMKNIFYPTLLPSVFILFYFMHIITIFLLSSTIVEWFYIVLNRRKREKFQVTRTPLLPRTMQQLYPVISLGPTAATVKRKTQPPQSLSQRNNSYQSLLEDKRIVLATSIYRKMNPHNNPET